MPSVRQTTPESETSGGLLNESVRGGADMILTSESVALAKLKQAHKEEFDFYVEQARKNDAEDGKDLPYFPVRLQMFSLSDYLKAALEKAEYEPDGEVIFARVPEVAGFYFSQGETYEEARANLQDAIEGSVLIALQMGWEIPPIPGSKVKIESMRIE
jgi:predicted RNase H-like HicB family nuclease